ncbi:hypothetical protein J3R03_005068 [Actinoplanes couchii]|nr:hypothetical protein [Actinoplanes couchii]MDR6320872.1 hypothetical protein [Actinoplanes couchii]
MDSPTQFATAAAMSPGSVSCHRPAGPPGGIGDTVTSRLLVELPLIVYRGSSGHFSIGVRDSGSQESGCGGCAPKRPGGYARSTSS